MYGRSSTPIPQIKADLERQQNDYEIVEFMLSKARAAVGLAPKESSVGDEGSLAPKNMDMEVSVGAQQGEPFSWDG